MAKKLNTIGIVFLALAAVGLILAIVGMCTPIISQSQLEVSIGLFDEEWSQMAALADAAAAAGVSLTVPTRTFTLIAFIVALIGVLVVLVNGILGMLGKDNKILGLAGGAVAIVGGVLVLVAGLVLAGQFNDWMKLAGTTTVGAGIGIWLGAIGGILAGVAGLLGALKVGQKD